MSPPGFQSALQENRVFDTFGPARCARRRPGALFGTEGCTGAGFGLKNDESVHPASAPTKTAAEVVMTNRVCAMAHLD